MTALTPDPSLEALGECLIRANELAKHPRGPMRERVLGRIRDQFDRDLAYKAQLAEFEKRRGAVIDVICGSDGRFTVKLYGRVLDKFNEKRGVYEERKFPSRDAATKAAHQRIFNSHKLIGE